MGKFKLKIPLSSRANFIRFCMESGFYTRHTMFLLNRITDKTYLNMTHTEYLKNADILYKEFSEGKIHCIDYMQLSDWLEYITRKIYRGLTK